jgi:hyperosmotically inducible protein
MARMLRFDVGVRRSDQRTAPIKTQDPSSRLIGSTRFHRKGDAMNLQLNRSGLVAVALTIAAATFVLPAVAGPPDAWVTTKVKMSLITSPEVGGVPIDVDTFDGRVTLHGKVTTAAERAEAERIAAGVQGVRTVRNLIEVVPQSKKKAVAVKDSELKERVTARLKADPDLGDVWTKSVNDGSVLLAGKVGGLSDHLHALEVANEVEGVKKVSSEIESPDTFGDREIWYDDTPAPSGLSATMGDAWITAKTKFKFMTDADVPAGDINVDTHHGTVTLFGIVPSKAVRDKANAIAKETSGVRAVKDELKVVAPSKKEAATAQDGDLAGAIRERLKGIDGANIDVEVKASVARLTGSVQRAMDRYTAVSIARATDGVSGVKDDIKLEPASATRE